MGTFVAYLAQKRTAWVLGYWSIYLMKKPRPIANKALIHIFATFRIFFLFFVFLNFRPSKALYLNVCQWSHGLGVQREPCHTKTVSSMVSTVHLTVFTFICVFRLVDLISGLHVCTHAIERRKVGGDFKSAKMKLA